MIAMQKENETSVRKDVEQTDSTLERTDQRPGPSADLTPHPFRRHKPASPYDGLTWLCLVLKNNADQMFRPDPLGQPSVESRRFVASRQADASRCLHSLIRPVRFIVTRKRGNLARVVFLQ